MLRNVPGTAKVPGKWCCCCLGEELVERESTKQMCTDPDHSLVRKKMHLSSIKQF